MAFNPKDLLNWKKIQANAPWLIAGAIGGVIVYKFLWEPMAMNVVPVGSAIRMRSPTLIEPPEHHVYNPDIPTYNVWPTQTSTYGCAGCTGSIGVTSPTDRVRFY